MAKYFIPYSGEKPVPLEINGHKLILLAEDKRSINENLEEKGADHIEVITTGEGPDEPMKAFQDLARTHEAGVVVMPRGADYRELVRMLEIELPWLQ